MGCDPSEISTYGDNGSVLTRTWRATCHGREYQCSGASRETAIPFLYDVAGATCSPMEAPAASSHVVAREPPPLEEGMNAQHRSFTTTFALSPFTAQLYGVPAISPRQAAFFIEVPPALARRRCDVALTIDGELTAPLTTRWEKETLAKISLPVQVLASMGKAEAVAGRVCDEVFRFDARAHRSVKAFAIRFQEEAALSTKTATNASAP